MTKLDEQLIANVMSPVIDDLGDRITILETKVAELGKDAEIKKLSERLEDQRLTITNLQGQLQAAHFLNAELRSMNK